MVNLVSLYLLQKLKQNLFHYYILNLFLTCPSALRSFSLTVFIKFFADLNHKKGKQEETTID